MSAARRLLLAAVLLALALAGLAALVAALGGPVPGPVAGAVAAPVPVLLAAAATRSPAARRRAPAALTGAGLVAAGVACVALALGVAVLALGRLPRGAEREVLLAALAGTAVAVVATGPLRRAVRRLAPRGAPEEALRRFGDRASRGVPLEELLLQLAEQLRQRLALSSVEVWTGDGSALDRLLGVPSAAGGPAHLADLSALSRIGVAGEGWARTWQPDLLAGTEGGQLRLAAASYEGVLLGLLVARRRGDDARFGAVEERALLDAATRLGGLLHSRRLDAALQSTLDDLQRTNEELRASRSRLVAAADAERRRLERDLHDGAQQHLVALAVNLALAADLVEPDPAGARELLEQTRAEAREAVGQLRDLAHGLYPPLLLESGLVAALRSLPSRRPGLQVRAEDVPRCPAPVEAALYFCVLEALQNASKHAAGAPVRVLVRGEPAGVRVEVADDGPGLPAELPTGGQGRQNMQDRMGAVGGSVRWDSPPGAGTVVHLSVPVARVVEQAGPPPAPSLRAG